MKNQGGSRDATNARLQREGKASGLAFPGLSRILSGILGATTGVPPEMWKRFEDEGQCRRCGTCCYSAVRVQDRMVLLKDLPCKHLAYLPDGRAFCRVYHLREMTGWCHPISVESIRKELYPRHCPYLDGLPHYRGKVELSGEEFEKIKPVLRKIFKGWPRPLYVRAGDWERFLRDTLGIGAGA